MLKKGHSFLLLLLILTVHVLRDCQDTGLTFVGKIEEIATKTTMTWATEKNLSIKLDSKPKVDSGCLTHGCRQIRPHGTTASPQRSSPDKIKGVGWKVG